MSSRPRDEKGPARAHPRPSSRRGAGTLRSDLERLEDILGRCRLLAEHVAPRVGELESDPVLLAAAMYWIAVIGEAAANVSPELRARHPDVPWRGPIGMRQILVHAYFGTDEDVVRDVVLRAAPALAAQIEGIIEELR